MNQHDISRLVVTFRGTVQGVGFRMTAVQLVGGAPITGWVRNEPDGSVAMQAEGPRLELEQFLARVEERMQSRIDDVQAEWTAPTGRYERFEIAY